MTSSPALAALELSEATLAKIHAAEEALALVQRSVTQRDWLHITQRLDHTRQQVIEDGGLRLLALAWVKEKNAHGGASWDVLLDMTDEDLLALHGFPTHDDSPDETPAQAPAAPEVHLEVHQPSLEAVRDLGDPHRP